MKEFGSDFHYIIPKGKQGNGIGDFFPNANYYADGRQALIHLYHSQGWERLWIPDYFCYDVIESLIRAGLELKFYPDNPLCREDGETLNYLQRNGYFKAKDAVLRVNYFGMRSYRSPVRLKVPVIEDHTHDIIGNWSANSHADWCIVSLRKTLPLPEGGMLWSPTGLQLPEQPKLSDDNESIAAIRWEAMKLKKQYLAGEDIDKASFRTKFLETEEFFERADICALDRGSLDYLKTFNVLDWYIKKKENWRALKDIIIKGVKVMEPENVESFPFSLVLLFNSTDVRERLRKHLITNQIYPAILWAIPNSDKRESYLFSKGMLSIHCDGRYAKEEILHMRSILESFFSVDTVI